MGKQSLKKSKKPRYFKKVGGSGKDREKLGKKGEKKQPQQFPNIYRRITDPFEELRVNFPEGISRIEGLLISKSKFLISLMISLVILTLIVSFGVDFYRNLQNRRDLDLNREKIAAEISYWQQVVGKYNNYRDGYFQLSVLEYKIGEKDQSRLYLQKVLELDPNFEAARNLEKLL